MMPPMQAFGFLLFRDMIVSGSFIEVLWYASAYRFVVRRGYWAGKWLKTCHAIRSVTITEVNTFILTRLVEFDGHYSNRG
jgi:hypothetical protein